MSETETTKIEGLTRSVVKEIVPAPKPAASAQSFKLQEYATNRWVVSPSVSTTYERVLEPDYWQHIGFNLRPGDIIEVHPETGEYWAELMVRSATRVEANVVELRKKDFSAETVRANVTPVSVEWKGPVRKYALVRGGQIVADGFQTKEEALAAVGSYNKEFAA